MTIENEIENPNNELAADLNSPEIQDEGVTEPKPKRKYKPRETKIKVETLDANETPNRKPRVKKASVEKTAKQLQGMHQMVAMLPNLGFMQISPEEATLLAEALLGVAEEYDIQISGKAGATLSLLAAAGMVYTPRALYVIQEKAKAKKLQTENLFQTSSEQNLSADVVPIKNGKNKQDTDLKTE